MCARHLLVNNASTTTNTPARRRLFCCSCCLSQTQAPLRAQSASALCALHLHAELIPHLPALSDAANALTSERVHYLPAYGCALLALAEPRFMPSGGSCSVVGEDSPPAQLLAGPDLALACLELHLVCLDGWEFQVHR